VSEVILKRVIQTCASHPSQWDAWDADGNYWYLRYRFAHGTAERQPGPDPTQWTSEDVRAEFATDRGEYDGDISLAEFCQLAGLNIHPEAVLL
jgi:hypothetical protein